MKSADKDPSRIKFYLFYAVGIFLFGPFVLGFIGVFFGLGVPNGKIFDLWFLAALTMCGMITFVNLVLSGRANKRHEFGCLAIIALATIWVGHVLFKMF